MSNLTEPNYLRRDREREEASKAYIAQLIETTKPRGLHRLMFHLAKSYMITAELATQQIEARQSSDFAAPLAICSGLSIELLLKFFIAIKFPDAIKVSDLPGGRDALHGHGLAGLFERVHLDHKARIAHRFGEIAGENPQVEVFSQALKDLGDVFMTWRYIYEREGSSQHLNLELLRFVGQALGEVAAELLAESAS